MNKLALIFVILLGLPNRGYGQSDSEVFAALQRHLEARSVQTAKPRTSDAVGVATGSQRAAKAVAHRPKYPTSPRNGRHWTGCRNWQHLTVGQHAGKYDPAWLASLTWNQLQSLHADDHEGVVRWEAVVRGAGKSSTRVSTRTTTAVTQSSCPGGNCPTRYRVRLFGR